MVPRKDIFDPTTVGIYHLFSRCVRQLFLLGYDGLTRKQNKHRRKQMIRYLRKLVKQFGLDVLDFALMENHVHCIVRNRPDIVETWSDLEVATRWWYLCPKKKDKFGNAKPPTEHDLGIWMNNPKMMVELRLRLSNISWLMWFWMQNIARFANREDGKKGHFVEGRFKCQRLEDEGAVLACSIYLALNPERADMVEHARDYVDGSFYRRVVSQMKRSQRLLGVKPDTNPAQPECDSWIAQFFLDERSVAYDSEMVEVDGEPRLTPQSNPHGSPRVSNKGYLPVSWDKYLNILEWTAENVKPKADGPSEMPVEVQVQLDRLGIDPKLWLETILNWDELFGYMIGAEDQLKALAEQYGRVRYRGGKECGRRFGLSRKANDSTSTNPSEPPSDVPTDLPPDRSNDSPDASD